MKPISPSTGNLDRVQSALDILTISETPRGDRAFVLGLVMGYAVGGLLALGVSRKAIRFALEQSLSAAPEVNK